MLDDATFWAAFGPIARGHRDRPCVITPHRTSTYGEVHDRASAFAGFLRAHGLGVRRSRADLAGWESGQDHVAIYLGDGVEYVEVMAGALRARTVPANINYRYVASELAQVLSNIDARAIVYDAELGLTLRDALASLPHLTVLVEVGGDDEPVVTGALRYEDLVPSAAAPPDLRLGDEPIPDDLCIVCTGGTTGLPKAVLWRQADLIASLIGERHVVTGRPVSTVDALIHDAADVEMGILLGPPLMHLTGFGLTLVLLMAGGTLVLADPPRGMDASSIWSMVERHGVQLVVSVGDAMGRPLLEELQRGSYDTSALRAVANGGATLSPEVKSALREALGGRVRVVDGVGSSESGVLARDPGKGDAKRGVFTPTPAAAIVTEDRDGFLEPGDERIGWLAGAGPIPLGYLGDPEKTAATFLTIGDRRCTVPGDKARWLPDGTIELLGRDATTINSGGEKIFSDEVEGALTQHPSVKEALVVGRPSERWGQEVVGLVVLEPSCALDPAAILEEAGRHLARYKLPKQLIAVPEIVRTAVGKADYAWGRAIATGATLPEHRVGPPAAGH